MTSRRGTQPATKVGNNVAHKQPSAKKLPYASRYVAVDSHLVDRKGSTNPVSAVAGERPAGRKLAQDIANACNQLDGEGYEVFSIIPTLGGRIIELTGDEEETELQDQTHGAPTGSVSEFIRPVAIWPKASNAPTVDEYEPIAVGYSVTDGVIITAKFRG